MFYSKFPKFEKVENNFIDWGLNKNIFIINNNNNNIELNHNVKFLTQGPGLDL